MLIKQVKFKAKDEDEILGGILIDNEYVICGCCGSVFEKDDVEIIQTLKWIPISDEIIGD